VIVAGLGGAGSATLYHLAGRGVSVVGIDQFDPPHTRGSSHGQSRIIREAYWEHPLYVPLVRRAYDCWQELSEASGIPVYRRTGGLMLGPADGAVVSGSLASARAYGISHEILTAAEVRHRFPGFTPPDAFHALWEERAGVIFPEAAIASHMELARRRGAVVYVGLRVLGWKADRNRVRVETTGGSIEAGMLVLSAGPWSGALAGVPGQVFQVEQQFFHSFKPTVDSSRWPVALWEYCPGGQVYTVPEGPDRVKGGIHHEGTSVDPDAVSGEVESDTRVRRLLSSLQPGALGPLLESQVCLYTNTPDRDFVIDRHPDHENVLVVSACSGHGFKFTSAIGEIVADLASTGRSSFDLSPFSLSRFAGHSS
jgi:sarcosine oxidase